MPDPLIYLDHAAATPLDPKVAAAMRPYLSERFFNPSAAYAPAIAVRHDYQAAKQGIARAIGAKADELIMTAGATESINLALHGVGGPVLTSNIEHHAVLAAAARQGGVIVAADERGRVSAEAVKLALTDDIQLVSIALANNELGTIQPLRDIAEVVKAESWRFL